MERVIQPVQPIRKIKAVRGVKTVNLYKRLRAKSRLHATRLKNRPAAEEAEPESNIENHARHTPEHVGDHVDFKA